MVVLLGDHLPDQPLLKRKKHGCYTSWLSLDGKYLSGWQDLQGPEQSSGLLRITERNFSASGANTELK